MGSKKPIIYKQKTTSNPKSQRQKDQDLHKLGEQAVPGNIIHRARQEQQSLTSGDVLHLQRTIGNKAARRILGTGISPANVNASVQRQPKQTETQIIGSAAVGGFTGAHSQQLIDKMDKKQSLKKARAIAAQIEQETSNSVATGGGRKEQIATSVE